MGPSDTTHYIQDKQHETYRLKWCLTGQNYNRRYDKTHNIANNKVH